MASTYTRAVYKQKPIWATDTSKKNTNESNKSSVHPNNNNNNNNNNQKQEIVSFTWACDISTGSLKTVQVTASLQGGVVKEPGYR